MEIPLDAITPDPDQPRKLFDVGALEDLSFSIEEHGVLQPIVVRPDGEGRYVIIAGERRWRASRLAKRDTIPAVVRDDLDSEVVAITENAARSDLNPMEEARAFERLRKRGLSVDAVARAVGRSPLNVNERLALLRLRPEFQGLVESGQMKVAVARVLARLHGEEQFTAVKALTTHNLTAAAFESLVAQMELERAQQALFDELKAIPEEVQRAKRRLDDAVEKAALALHRIVDSKTMVLLEKSIDGQTVVRLRALKREVSRVLNEAEAVASRSQEEVEWK
jgi:ParB family chromosome partitioning protein